MNLRNPLDLACLVLLGVMCAAVPPLTIAVVFIAFSNALGRAVTK